jgi:hypothetical protein
MVGAFKWHEWRHYGKVVPTHWLTSGEMIARDLEYFDEQGADSFFRQETLDGFASSRDSLNEKILAQSRINFTVFLFLMAQYVSIELDLSVFGIQIKKAPGVTEALLCFLLVSETINLMRSRSLYFIESTMHSIIQRITPIEVRPLVLSKYFPLEQFGPYIPFNLPHMSPYKAVSLVNVQSAIFILLAVIMPLLLIYCYAHIVLIYNVWLQGSLGLLSRIIAIYLFSLFAFNIIYAMLFRIRMPYRDFSNNHFIELTRQYHPKLVSRRLDETWGVLSRERIRLIELGYLKDDLREGELTVAQKSPALWKKAIFLLGVVATVAAALGFIMWWLT